MKKDTVCPRCSSVCKSFCFDEKGHGHYFELWGCEHCEVGVAHDTTSEGIEEARSKWNLFVACFSDKTTGEVTKCQNV